MMHWLPLLGVLVVVAGFALRCPAFAGRRRQVRLHLSSQRFRAPASMGFCRVSVNPRHRLTASNPRPKPLRCDFRPCATLPRSYRGTGSKRP